MEAIKERASPKLIPPKLKTFPTRRIPNIPKIIEAICLRFGFSPKNMGERIPTKMGKVLEIIATFVAVV